MIPIPRSIRKLSTILIAVFLIVLFLGVYRSCVRSALVSDHNKIQGQKKEANKEAARINKQGRTRNANIKKIKKDKSLKPKEKSQKIVDELVKKLKR